MLYYNIINNNNFDLSSFMCIFRDMFHSKDTFLVDDINCSDNMIIINIKFIGKFRYNMHINRITKVVNKKLNMAKDWICNK